MITSMNLDSLEVITGIEDLVFSFNNKCQKALDDNAPLKEKTITYRDESHGLTMRLKIKSEL